RGRDRVARSLEIASAPHVFRVAAPHRRGRALTVAVETPPGPRKPFREEAQASTVQCPACGGPLTLRGFGGIEHVVCPYCGSASTPAEHGALRVLAEVTRRTQRARRTSVLPLYRRGTFEGAPWEILGIVWRECRVDGEVYPWQEFLLYNPYRGYRYL